MSLIYHFLFLVLWMSWGVYWWVLSSNVKHATRREPMVSRFLHIVPLLLAALLLGIPHLPIPVLGERFLPLTAWPFWVGATLTVVGLLFTVWARQYIGRNWSGIVTIKEDHELITSGPYSLVRHPIYSGLLLAFIGSAVALAEWRGVLAVALVAVSQWRKLQMEENWMSEKFGGAYQSYRKRVAALVPFLF